MAKNKLNERGWEKLLSEIDKGNVVPILGNELLKIKINGQEQPFYEYIVKSLCEIIDIEYVPGLDFEQLTCQSCMLKWREIDSDPYYETYKLIKETDFDVSPSVSKLLDIDKFKLVLTTTFDNICTKSFEKKWGIGNFKRLSYEKRTNGQDIETLNQPILYHMFGKASNESHSYVLTEDDLLEFLHFWLNDNYKPKKISNILREKYLLIIGCNYPNWLFRFFLHSMKFSTQSTPKSKIGMIAESNMDSDLIAYLSRLDAQMYIPAEEFINELAERWVQYKIDNPDELLSEYKDVFISYASEDEHSASLVAETFRKLGVTVWFDKRALEPADEYLKVIKKNIEKSKAFVPILSKHVMTPERRFFKREWTWGIEQSEWINPSPYIFPITIDDINIQNELIPVKFSSLQKVDFFKSDFEDNVKKIIRSIRR
ncbi:toll/interleukin-1 receptor domain-containing protein [Paludibacter sp.]|uniref:toll/interleukin-1 receptor domain-containing protein n=1 Tax=Paludibacter sp. TaxID=1898105 RepID=UPI0013521E98|nr:toll/interleukin-1 receptor domain-containing protein [Paludibacter sp.]MTK53113.1 toll/interleukin-1 receptor domain-containing protein [Paludibacter sp.]